MQIYIAPTVISYVVLQNKQDTNQMKESILNSKVTAQVSSYKSMLITIKRQPLYLRKPDWPWGNTLEDI